MMIVDSLNIHNWIVVAISLLLIGSMIKIQRIKKENRLLSEQLGEAALLRLQLHAELQTLKTEYARIKEFQHSMDEAELTTRLQKPRMNVEETVTAGNTPEKYRYISSLSARGFDAQEIASILAISPQEAEQLVSLANIARKK